MSVLILVNEVDRTENISLNLNLSRALTSQVDSCNFEVVRNLAAESPDWKPADLDIVKIYDNGSMIFGGQIIGTTASMKGGDIEVIAVQCKDFGFDMDRSLIVTTYEMETVNDILDDFRDNWLPAGYNTDNVDCPEEVTFIAFNYEYPTKCIQQLAELFNYEWYVDGQKNIYFKARTTTPAPFELNDDNGMYFFDSLVIKTDVKNLRNRVYVSGGTYQGDTETESLVADGEATVYKQGYRYSNISVEVDGVPQTVGVDNFHLAADYDVLYNFSEKALKWRDDNKPAATDVIDVTGNPHKPILVRQQDLPSITDFGVFEYKISDASIETKQAARDRAEAELNEWKDKLNEGTFSTKESGLQVGQIITIQSDKRGIDMDFVITRISSTLRNPEEFLHTCTLATTKTYGMIEFLQGLLMQRDKDIKVDELAILDIFLSLADAFEAQDTIASVAVNSPPYYWADAATHPTDEMRWNFFTWT